MPLVRSRYPADWEEISKRVREEAGQKCEQCGVRNKAVGYRDPVTKEFRECAGESERANLKAEYGGRIRFFTIVLTCAHLDHDTTNNERSNLKAWCQRCHLTYDAKHHAKNAAATRRAKQDRTAVCAPLMEVS